MFVLIWRSTKLLKNLYQLLNVFLMKQTLKDGESFGSTTRLITFVGPKWDSYSLLDVILNISFELRKRIYRCVLRFYFVAVSIKNMIHILSKVLARGQGAWLQKKPVSLASGQLQVLTSVGKHNVWSGVTRIISSPNQSQDALACVNGRLEIFIVFCCLQMLRECRHEVVDR